MKKFGFTALILLICVCVCACALLAVSGCSSKPSIREDESDTIRDESDTAESAEDDEEVIKDVVLDGDIFSYYDFDVMSRLSGYNCKAIQHMPEEVLVKLLAEDSDVDIYFLPIDTVFKIKKMGLYYPIESDIIKDFNDSCFDSMRDAAINDNGDTVGMVTNSSVKALVYPAALEEETGVDIQSLTTLDEVLDFIESYEGDRVGYISDDECFYYQLLAQYEKYFCDFKNKSFDYDTDLYRKIYTTTLLKLNEDGKLDSFYGMTPIGYGGFKNNDFDIDKLFMADAGFVEVIEKSPEFVSGLRAIPLPKINDDCINTVTVQYAVINPYSKNKKGAVKVLETIAQNRDKVGFYYGKYTLIKKDISDYSDKYMTDTRVFKDYYNIMANGVISEYWFSCYQYRYDVDDYRSGKTTAAEAIAEYQRMIDIWLNE